MEGGNAIEPPAGFRLDSFELTLVDIAAVPIDSLYAHSIGVRWPHRAEDWAFLRSVGQGVAVEDEIGRLVGTAMWFPYGPDFATIGMVITSPRLQTNGAAGWLMEQVMRQAGPRLFGLNATHAARRLYLSMGFQIEKTLYQCHAEPSLPPDIPLLPDTVLRPVRPDDLALLVALDAAAFGAERTDLLAKLLAVSEGVVLLRDGAPAAFALSRRFGRGHVIGPVVAARDEDAVAVARPLIAEHTGRFLRLDTRESGGPFFDFLTGCGFSIYDTVTTMSLGRPWTSGKPAGEPLSYAVAAQTLG